MCVGLGCAETHGLRKIEDSCVQRSPDLNLIKINTLQRAVLQGELISVYILMFQKQLQLSPLGNFSVFTTHMLVSAFSTC